jgi:hypothetical protein
MNESRIRHALGIRLNPGIQRIRQAETFRCSVDRAQPGRGGRPAQGEGEGEVFPAGKFHVQVGRFKGNPDPLEKGGVPPSEVLPEKKHLAGIPGQHPVQNHLGCGLSGPTGPEKAVHLSAPEGEGYIPEGLLGCRGILEGEISDVDARFTHGAGPPVCTLPRAVRE